MKTLNAEFVADKFEKYDLKDVSYLLDGYAGQTIGNLLWSDNDYKPDVNFSIAYSKNSIFLKYRVAEEYIKADYHTSNDPVYEDSCVEFFIAFNDDAQYYNLEFNCLGTALAGYGKGKDRNLLPADLIQRIETHHTITMPPDIENGPHFWELTLKIPFSVFQNHTINSLHGVRCRGNFYKCGDKLPLPHFLSWNKIDSQYPDFHLPEFFGSIRFV